MDYLNKSGIDSVLFKKQLLLYTKSYVGLNKKLLSVLRHSITISATLFEKTRFVSLIGDIYQINSSIITPIACAAELMMISAHTFDDILDSTEQRKGQPTVWRKYGIEMAIISADLLSSISYSLIRHYKSTYNKKNDVIDLFCETKLNLLKGQALIETFNKKLSRKCLRIAIEAAELRAGYLISFCFSIAPLLAEQEDDFSTLQQAGFLVGTAMQVRDDILDYLADDKKVSKNWLEDFDNAQPNVVTGYLVVAILKHKNKEDLDYLNSVWNRKLNLSDKKRIKTLALKYEAVQEAMVYVNTLCEQAELLCSILPKSKNKNSLFEILELLKFDI